MKKTILLLSLVLSFVACEKNQSSNDLVGIDLEKTNFTGVTFENWGEFKAIYEELSKSDSEEDIMNWLFETGHQSLYLREIQDLDDDYISKMEVLTPELLALVNYDFEFKIGNEIIRYDDSKFYSFPENLDFETAEKKVVGEINTTVIDIIEGDVIEGENENKLSDLTAIGVPGNSGGPLGQMHRDFTRIQYLECGSNKKILGRSSRPMRFFHQLTSKAVRWNGCNYDYKLYLQFKLFWRNSKNKLRYATKEQRNYDINLNGTIRLGNNNTKSFYLNKDLNCIRSDRWYDYKLSQEIADGCFGIQNWNFNVSGSIVHQINGDSSSARWLSYINW